MTTTAMNIHRSTIFIATLAVLVVAGLIPVAGSGPSFRPDTTFSGSALANWRPLGDADWKAQSGEITGTPKQPGGGWLVLGQSYQDAAFFASFRCAAGCKTGVLMRAEKTPSGGMKGVFLSLDAREPAAAGGFGGPPPPVFAVTLDAQGKELSREPLRQGGGQIRIAPAVDPNAPVRGGGAGRGAAPVAPAAPAAAAPAPAAGTPPPAALAAGGGRGRGAAPALTTPLPVVTQPTAIRPGEWNSVEILADANIVRLIINNGGSNGGVAEDEVGRYGPIALYVGGTGAVTFKDVAYKDLMVSAQPVEQVGSRFKMQRLNPLYYSWGASADDFNHDGVLDVVSGPHIYYGPEYTKRREIYLEAALSPSTAYSGNVWMQFSADFTGDGWADALNCGFSGAVAGCNLFVNPKGESRRWDKFRVTDVQQTEVAVMADVNADGKPDIVYGGGGAMRWATPDPTNPTGPWKVHIVSENGTATAHGVGAGDLNGDGRMDILNAYGWWEQPAPASAASASGDALWAYHPAPFSRSVGTRASAGGSVMAVYDVNGDKLNDVVTSLSAHGWGLAWYEQKKDASGAISFVQHMIMDDHSTKNAGDVTFSEPHGSTVADIDDDGIPDFIVGKRYWAHLDDWTDPDVYGDPVLYVYRTVRNTKAAGGAELVPELVHNQSGAGSHVFAGDLNKDGRMDIVTATKFGTFIFWGQAAGRR